MGPQGSQSHALFSRADLCPTSPARKRQLWQRGKDQTCQIAQAGALALPLTLPWDFGILTAVLQASVS